MTFRKCGVMAVFLCATAAGCWQVKAPAPPVPEGGPLPVGAVARVGDSLLAPHDPPMGSLVFSPDGKRLASFTSWGAGADLCIWDVPTGKQLHRFAAKQRSWMDDLAWSPDGKILAQWDNGQWSETSEITFLDSETGKELYRIGGAKDEAATVAVTFSPDHKTVVWCSRDGFIHLYDLDAKKETQKVPAAEEPGDCDLHFAFTPDGQTVVEAHYGVASVIDLKTNKEIVRFRGEGLRFRAVAISPDGKTLAVGTGDGFRLFDLGLGKDAVGMDIDHPRLAIDALCFSADGKTLTSATANGQCVVWDLAVKKVKRQFELMAYKGRCYGASNPVFSPDGNTLAWTSGRDHRIHLSDVATGEERHHPNEKPLTDLFAFTADGNYVAAPCLDGKLRLWNAATGKLVCVFDEDASDLQFLEFTADGKRVMGVGQTARVWDVETGKATLRIEQEIDLAEVVGTISPDGKTLALGEAPMNLMDTHVCQIRWIDLQSGKVISRSDHDGSFLGAVAFAPDGKTMASLDAASNVFPEKTWA